MSYSDLYFQSQSRPSRYMVIAAVIVAVSAVIVYYSSSVKFTRASKQTVSKHQVVNVLPQQSGVFWEVPTVDQGWVTYGENPSKLDQVAVDERDIDKRKERLYHYVVLKNLKPDTLYYYRLISNSELISDPAGAPFTLRTLPESLPGNTLSPAYGTIVLPDGQPLEEAVVLVNIGGAVPLASTTGQTGEWLVPMQHIVQKETLRPSTVELNTILTINVYSENQQSVVKSTISKASPLPQTVIIGKNYSFLEGDNVLSTTDKPTKSNNSGYRVEIRYPKQNAVIPGSSPIINGKGIPNEYVTVSIDANPVFSRKVKVDQEGNWLIEAKTTFRPGAYTLILNTKTERGQTINMSRRFTIIKSGEQVLATTATPSGSVTPIMSPTGSLTPTGSITPNRQESPTPEPTEIVDATLTPT